MTAQQFPDFPALTMTDAELRLEAARHPSVGQTTAALTPTDHLGNVVELSPYAADHPVIGAMLDRYREAPPFWSMHRDSFPNWILGNVGRPLLTFRSNGYDELELACLSSDAWTDEGLVLDEAEYELFYEQACYGGSPVQSIVIHSPENDHGSIAYPLMANFSHHRQLRTNDCLGEYLACAGCEEWSPDAPDDRGVENFLMVTCGGLLRVFPMCGGCRTQLDRDMTNLAWLVASDRSFFQFGCADDVYL